MPNKILKKWFKHTLKAYWGKYDFLNKTSDLFSTITVLFLALGYYNPNTLNITVWVICLGYFLLLGSCFVFDKNTPKQ